MKSLMQAFCLFTMGALPNAVASAVSQGEAAWVPNNLNNGNLALAYMVNCGIGLTGLLLFWTMWRIAPPHVKGLEPPPLSEDGDASDQTEESSEEDSAVD